MTNEDGIDLVDLAGKVWSGRRIVLAATFLFALIGGGYLLFKRARAVPEYESTSLVHIDQCQPNIIGTLQNNNTFFEGILEKNLVYGKTKDTLSVKEFITEQTKGNKGETVAFSDRVKITLAGEGVVELRVRMQDPELAKQLLDSIIPYLVIYVTGVQTKKTRMNLAFVNERYKNAEQSYLQALHELSAYLKQNRVNSRDTIDEKQLRSMVELKFNVYENLALDLEKIRIEDNKLIPVISVLNSPTLAVLIEKVNEGRVLLLFTFIGLFVGIGLVLLKEYGRQWKMLINKD